MNLHHASYQSHPEPTTAAVPYRYENLLGDIRNVSHRRRRRPTLLGWFVLALVLAVVLAICASL